MKIYKKLYECKKEIGKISKDSTNPFFKSKYFDINALLEHVEPILQKHGLLLLQPILGDAVISEIIDIETGEKVESEVGLTALTDPQKRGSEITYYRRYTLQSLLGLQAEDDDANKASGNNSAPKAEPVKWLNEKQFNAAIEGGVDTIKKTLDFYDGNTIRDGFKYCMKKDYKDKLNEKLQ